LRLQGEALALDWPGRQLASDEMPAEPLAEAPAQELFEPVSVEAEAEPLHELIDASAEQPGGELIMEAQPESEAAPEPIESQAEALELAELLEPRADLELPVELPELSEEVLELPELALPELTLPELPLAEPPLLTDEAAVPVVPLAPDLADLDLGLDLELPALSDELPAVQPTPTEFMEELVELPSWQATAIEPAPTVLSEGPDTELLTELATELLPDLGPELVEAEPLLGDAGLMLELETGAAADAQPPVLTDLLELDLLGEGEAAQAQAPTDVLPAAAETVLSELPSEAEDAAASEFASLDALDLPLTLDLPLDAAEAAPETVSQAVPDFELPEFELNLDLGELVGESVAPAEPEVVAEAEDAAETEAEALADLASAIEPPVAAPAVPHLSLVSSGDSQGGDVDAGEGEAAEESAEEGDEGVKRIGSLRIGITLFNIFLNEADELSRRLATGLAEWAMELSPPLPAQCEALARAGRQFGHRGL